MMTGTSAASRFTTAAPPTGPGMFRSSSTTSGRSVRMTSSASNAVPAIVTS
jgi:hypothetical protein